MWQARTTAIILAIRRSVNKSTVYLEAAGNSLGQRIITPHVFLSETNWHTALKTVDWKEEEKETREKLLYVPWSSVSYKNKYCWNEKLIGTSIGLCKAACDENQVHLPSLICRESGSCREISLAAWHGKGSVQPSFPKHSIIRGNPRRKMSLLMFAWYLRCCWCLADMSSGLCCKVVCSLCACVKMGQLHNA